MPSPLAVSAPPVPAVELPEFFPRRRGKNPHTDAAGPWTESPGLSALPPHDVFPVRHLLTCHVAATPAIQQTVEYTMKSTHPLVRRRRHDRHRLGRRQERLAAGEMRRALTPLGIRTPDGFATTAECLPGLPRRRRPRAPRPRHVLADLDSRRHRRAAASRRPAPIGNPAALRSPPGSLRRSREGYRRLERAGYGPRWTSRCGAVPPPRPAGRQLCRPAGDVPQRAGRGVCSTRAAAAFASLFTDRAISIGSTRIRSLKVALSIGVQQMVRSDLASSGVMFSLDTETGFRDAVLINGAYGLGENVVQGAVDPG